MRFTFSPLNNVKSKSSRFRVAMISVIKSKSNLMATNILKIKCKSKNIGIKIFKTQKNRKVKKEHKHTYISFMIQLGKINRRFYKRFMQVINTLHVNVTFITKHKSSSPKLVVIVDVSSPTREDPKTFRFSN